MTTYYMPYVLYGYAYDRSNNLIREGYVYVKNTSTGEEVMTQTNSAGQYAFDCANFELFGYTAYSRIELRASQNADIDCDIYVSLDGGSNWMQVENATDTTVLINAVRKKVDLTNNPSGLQLNLVVF